MQRGGQNWNRRSKSQITTQNTYPTATHRQMRGRLLLQLGQQFTPDFLTPAAPFDSVNNGFTLTTHYFQCANESVDLQIRQEKQWLIQSLR
jgi:hypothetical protein